MAKAIITTATLLDMVGNNWFKRLTSRRLLGDAADHLRSLDRELRDTKRNARQEIAKAKEDAASITQRTAFAIAEMERGKGNYKPERPVAVVLSPYQYGVLTMHNHFPQNRLHRLDILVAKGVYGPVVLTQDGLNGFTRNAPELSVRAVGPSKASL